MSLRDQLQLTLGTAYTITRELGGGGMSRVFVARDETLGRDVVVKVLRSDFAIELSAERFAREIRLAARLQQANIVPVLHAGEADGLPYYTMPFIEGASLRARLDRGPVPHVEAMHIVRDVARALAYAHGHGVVHRDIKPENVLLSAGTAVVTDFGIAKAIEHARDASAPGNLTGGGVQIGTPAYMAPEQAAGDVVDARADVYAWGMLAYELLAGQHPFADKRTSYELIAAHFTEIPAPLTDGGITPQLAGLVASCLSKRPDERPPNGAALLATLDATSESGVSSARLRIGSESKPSAPGSPKPSIAVLPFENMSADPENQYFADGVAEEITNALARLRDLRVAARMSAFSFRGTREDVRAVGERLGVATVLEGSVRRAGDRLRITAQLISVSDGCTLWSERFDRQAHDIFEVQDEIATAIAGTLEVTLAAGTSELVRPPTDDLEAFRIYHKGLAFLHRRGRATYDAVTCFEEAIARDPHFAQAHAELSTALSALGLWSGARPLTILARARDASARALQLGPDLAETYVAAALFAVLYDRDLPAASQAYDRAISLAPHNTYARAGRALWVLAGANRAYDEATAEMERVVEHDPLSAYAFGLQSNVAVLCGRFEEAVAAATRSVELDPMSFLSRIALVHGVTGARQYGALVDAAQRALAISGGHSWALASLATAYAGVGRIDAARAILAELKARSEYTWVLPTDLAVASLACGLTDEAVAHVERGFEERDPRIMTLEWDNWPELWQLRENPAYAYLRARVGWAT